MTKHQMLAAIDLGSNSFRLEIGRYEYGQITRIDYIKEPVRLGNGLDVERNLTPQAINRGLACLARFAERLQGLQSATVRAVATQTLREAKNRDQFLKLAQEILGLPIEIISGAEEARLIYSGAAHLLPQSEERRLVIDIGGRSTELVLGQGLQARHMASYRLGSVSWSFRYFGSGKISEDVFAHAQIAAQAILDEALTNFGPNTWDVAYGTSGTVGAVADILEAAGWPTGEISRDALDWMMNQMLLAGHTDQLQLTALKQDRKPVICGGVSVLSALMQLLNIDILHVAEGALRHGVQFEMIDRQDKHGDIRDTSIRRLALKCGTDEAQGKRVGDTALHFFEALQNQPSQYAMEHPSVRQLVWAAHLHEIGFAISHTDYHKHGAYILDNADVIGFGMPELHRISLLVLGHHGKLKKLEGELADDDMALMLIALRLAVVLCHARRNPHIEQLRLTADHKRKKFRLNVSTPWPEQFPQSTHLLRQEEIAWKKMPWTFTFAIDQSAEN
jgi:exopolyphosphatase/guanosine-5'-triphosphate,3'-diphosphate pyrophosphatase